MTCRLRVIFFTKIINFKASLRTFFSEIFEEELGDFTLTSILVGMFDFSVRPEETDSSAEF